jgi:hypothetical protein
MFRTGFPVTRVRSIARHHKSSAWIKLETAWWNCSTRMNYSASIFTSGCVSRSTWMNEARINYAHQSASPARISSRSYQFIFPVFNIPI